jgi:hypothetical protein
VRRLVLVVLIALAHRGDAQTLVLERAQNYAVLVDEVGGTYTYSIAIDDHGWRRLASVDIYLDGDSYLAGNCCFGRAGTPRYAFAVIDGVAILKVDLPLQRFYKANWGGGSGAVAEAYLHSEGVACWRADSGTRCKPVRFAGCNMPDRASVAVDGLSITSRCHTSSSSVRIDLN